MDIIAHYAFGESYNQLGEDDWTIQFKQGVAGAAANGVIMRQFPWSLPVMKAIPLPIM